MSYSFAPPVRQPATPIGIGFGNWILLLLVVTVVAGATSVATAFLLLRMSNQDMPAAPSSSAAERIIGVWRFDVDRTLESNPDYQNGTPEERETMRRMFEGMMGSMQLEFTGDRLIIHMEGNEKGGSYIVVAEDAHEVVIEARQDGSDDVDTLRLRMEGDDSMAFIEENGREQYLVRVAD